MNTKKSKRSFITVLFSILLVITIIALGGGIIAPDLASRQQTVQTVQAEESYIARPDTFGEFPNGYVYAYTDKTAAMNLRGGTATTDLKTQTVSTTATRGSAANPYVIETTDDWENFAKFTYNSVNKTKNLVFVLANDLDFSSVTTFRFIPSFSGSFYGLGHTLKNITISKWQYWNSATVSSGATSWANLGSVNSSKGYIDVDAKNVITFTGYGLFGLATNAAITDLSVENFSYSGMSSFKTSAQPWGNFAGGLVGNTSGTTFIGNCHVQGSVSVSWTQHAWWGGLVGMHTEASGKGDNSVSSKILPLTIYRCSADTVSNIKITGTYNIHDGGIIGDVGEGMAVNIYDCVTNRDVSNNTQTNQTGGIVGYTRPTSNITAENVVSYIKITNLTCSSKNNYGALYGYTNASYCLTAKNVWLNAYYGSAGTTNASFSTIGSCTASGVTVGPYITGYPTGTGVTTVKTTRDDVITAAKAAVGTTLSNKIWDATKFTTAGMGTFTPDKTPLRNHLVQVPLDMELTYTGEALDIKDASWYLESVHGNTDIMTYTLPTMVNVNEYGITFRLKDRFTWSDGTTSNKTITVKVTPKLVGIDWDTSNGIEVAKVNINDLALKDRANPPELINTYYKLDDDKNVVGGALSGAPTTVGWYRLVVTIEDGSNYKLKAEDSDADPSDDFKLTAIPIKTPTVSGGTSQMYNGTELTFLLMNDGVINEEKVAELKQENMPAGATYVQTGTKREIKVTQAGTYPIKFTLMDQTNTCWGDGGGVLRLVVEKRPIILTLKPGNAAESWEVFQAGTQETFTITHDAVDGDAIDLAIEYEKPETGERIQIGSDRIKTVGKVTTVTLERLSRGEHKLYVTLGGASASNANGNYVLEEGTIEQSFTVVGKQIDLNDLSSSLEWQYSDGSSAKTLAKNQKIDYCGKTITVSLKTDNLTEKGVKIKEHENQTGVDVGKYTTRVCLTRLNDSYEFVDRWYEIEWEIGQTIFDLTDVEWDYKDPIGYTGLMITVRLKNVPDALIATYAGNQSTDVTGDGYNKAEVTFKFKNSADENNYVLPKKSDPTSYKHGTGAEDNDGLFPWELQWQIAQGVISLDWDLQGGYQENGGLGFTYPTLLSGEKYIQYKYYKAQKTANGDYEKVGDAIALSSIVVNPTKPEPYLVEVVLKADAEDNFKLDPNGTNPRSFIAGDSRIAVKIKEGSTSFTYSGEPQGVDFELDDGDNRIVSKSDLEITYYDSENNRLDGAPVDAGLYTARITVKDDGTDKSLANTYYVQNGRISFEIKKFTVSAGDLVWDYDPAKPFTFEVRDGVEKTYTVTLKDVPTTLNLVYTNNSFSAASPAVGYKAEVKFFEENIDDEVKKNIDLAAVKAAFASVAPLTWKIEKHVLTLPNGSPTAGSYDGSPHDLIALLELDSDWAEYVNISVTKDGASITLDEAMSAVNAGSYSLTCSIMGKVLSSVVWQGGNAMAQESYIEIAPRRITVTGWRGKPAEPQFKDGGKENVNVIYKIKDGNDWVVVPNADVIGKKYLDQEIRASVEPKSDMVDNVWIVYDEDVEATYSFIMFTGGPTAIKYPTLVTPKLEFNFMAQEFEIENWDNYYRNYVEIVGAVGDKSPLKVDGNFCDTRIVKIKLKNDKNVEWADADSLHKYDVYELVIEVVRGELSQKWEYEKRGNYWYPVLSAEYLPDGIDDWSQIIEYRYRDKNNKLITNEASLKPNEDYQVVATIKSQYADFLCFGYTEGDDPQPMSSTEAFPFVLSAEAPGDDDLDDPIKKPDPNTSNLPLWQLIVGGVSALLFVVCLAKTFGEFGKLKAAKREAKELAAQSYYGFAPLPLLAMAGTFWGLNNTMWTVIAFVALGLFLISAVALLLVSKKRKAAELTVKREQARIAEEKEFAREEERREEQARRDNEMKMMFAAMQQQSAYQQPQQNYEDLRGLLAETVSALLPAMQQQMAALPPAQSDPNAYMQSGYVSPEAETLRAQMAQQQELMAQQQAQMAAQQAQMAKQQELINQLLQDRQSAPIQEEEEEDISWLGENDEVVSLEESYGALSDEGKRAYYEIGSYIMSKPRTSQNDGRYAVLFKYRGRTVFKLAIKDDAPVLYYPAGGVRGEVNVSDANALAFAKSMIDQSVALIDGQM